jgi:hypothetical protein
MGKLPTSKACLAYMPDVFTLAPLNAEASIEKDVLANLASCIGDFTVSELAVLGALFLGEKKTRQNGFQFWQKVYIRVVGTSRDNYLNNFVPGRILDASKDYVRIVSESGKTCIQVVNDKQSCTLYTVDRFKPFRKEMRDSGNLIDPSTERLRKRAASNRIDPIDLAVAAGLIDADFSDGKKVRKSPYMDLVGIVQKMASGRIESRKKKQYEFDGSSSGSISIHHR